MSYSFETNSPIYLQLVQLFLKDIVTGDWPPGGRVASVRDLAVQYGVNPNTVQRSLAELERDGLLFTERTSGRFITQNTELIGQIRDRLAASQIEVFLEQMRGFGYNHHQLQELVTEKWSEKYGHD